MRYIAERRNDLALAKQALGQIEAAVDVMRQSGHGAYIDIYGSQIVEAREVVAKLAGTP